MSSEGLPVSQKNKSNIFFYTRTNNILKDVNGQQFKIFEDIKYKEYIIRDMKILENQNPEYNKENIFNNSLNQQEKGREVDKFQNTGKLGQKALLGIEFNLPNTQKITNVNFEKPSTGHENLRHVNQNNDKFEKPLESKLLSRQSNDINSKYLDNVRHHNEISRESFSLERKREMQRKSAVEAMQLIEGRKQRIQLESYTSKTDSSGQQNVKATETQHNILKEFAEKQKQKERERHELNKKLKAIRIRACIEEMEKEKLMKSGGINSLKNKDEHNNNPIGSDSAFKKANVENIKLNESFKASDQRKLLKNMNYDPNFKGLDNYRQPNKSGNLEPKEKVTYNNNVLDFKTDSNMNPKSLESGNISNGINKQKFIIKYSKEDILKLKP